MKTITFLIFFIALVNVANAQSPNWLWASSAIGVGTSDETGRSVSTDAYGNIISVGYFSGDSLTFGSTILTNNGSSDIYITKYDDAGNILWAKSAGGTFDDFGNKVNVDASGNIFVVGNFSSPSITFDSITLNNSSVSNSEIFIVKYDASGNVLWAKSAGGSGYDGAGSIEIDNLGNIIIGANFNSPSITLGSTTLTNPGDMDIIVAKLDSAGNFLWAKTATGSGLDYGSIAVDDSGNVFVFGSYLSPTLTFGSTTITNAGGYDIFFGKYDSAGNLLWAKTAGGINADNSTSIAINASGNILVTGGFGSPSITFGTFTLSNPGTFLIKFDPAGNVIWGNSGDVVSGNSMAIDPLGNIIVAGYFYSATVIIGTDTFINADTVHYTSDIFIAEYDSSGNLIWAKTNGGTGVDAINGIAVDASGKIIVVGIFRSTNFTLGATTLINPDPLGYSNDLFIAKLDTVTITGFDALTSNNMTNIYPNPFLEFTTIMSYVGFKDATLGVYSLYGQLVKQLNNITGNSFTFHRDNLPNGVYFIRLTQDKKIISTNKFIIRD